MQEQGWRRKIELDRPANSPPGRYRWRPPKRTVEPLRLANTVLHALEEVPPDERRAIHAGRRDYPEAVLRGSLYPVWCGFS